MLRKRKIFSYLAILLFIFAISATIPHLNISTNHTDETPPFLHSSSSILDGAENVIITHLEREVDITNGAIFNVEDRIDVTNYNNNPITAILIGIPLNLVNNLVYFKGMGEVYNNLYTERTGLIVSDEYEMITIYFSSPLLPHQTKKITFVQSYIDLASYQLDPVKGEYYSVQCNTRVFPLFPYRAEGILTSTFYLPLGSEVTDRDGADNGTLGQVKYTQNVLEAFSENLNEDDTMAEFTYYDFKSILMEVNSVNRDIYISPWGTLIIEEHISIINMGIPEVWFFTMNLPKRANNIQTYDDLGTIVGTTVKRFDLYTYVNITLFGNRVVLKKNEISDFTVKYTLNLRDYLSVNWLQQSIKMNILSSDISFLSRTQTTRIIIDGCYSIDSISEPPDGIEKSNGKTILTYEEELVVSLLEHEILITYTIDLFALLLRPLILILAISILSAIYIIYVKKKKDKGISTSSKIENIPKNEIREFCSLYEEKNALVLEIRKAEEDLKRKKLHKKKFRNLVDKNESKIKVIEEEIKPFKKILNEANPTLENILQNLDIIEAERQTIEDGLKLLDSRYKKGKLPSRTAYEKLLYDFLKRRKKIDRTIDRYVQQLRNYLL